MSIKIPPPNPGCILEDGELEVFELENNSLTEDNFFGTLKIILTNNIKNIPNFIVKNMFWLIPLVISWTVLESISDFKIYTMPKPLSSLIKFLIFITASYNNFIAKGLYVIVVNNSVIPIIKELKSIGFNQTLDKYMKVFTNIKNSYAVIKEKSIGIILTFLGSSFIFSNLLTRNNKVDKYFISLLLSFSLISSLVKEKNNLFIKLFKSAAGSIMKEKSRAKDFVNVSIVSMSLGFLSSILFSFIRISNSYYDVTGYVVGLLVSVAGVIILLRGKSIEKK